MLKELPWYIEEERQRRVPASRFTIEELKHLVSMNDLLEHYGWDYSGGAWGKEWVSARCPFHTDGTPSASLNAMKNRFRCHQCGVAGDIIDVVGQREGIASVSEVMEWIMTTFKL